MPTGDWAEVYKEEPDGTQVRCKKCFVTISLKRIGDGTELEEPYWRCPACGHVVPETEA